jgi:D-alanyl-D-alanine carboxypeptidase
VVFGGRSAASRDRHMRKLLDLGFDRLNNGKQASIPNDIWYTPMRTYAVHWRFTKAPTPLLPPKRVDHTAASGNWGIQIGAFAQPTVAEKKISDIGRTMPGLINGKLASIDKIIRGDSVMYRARIGGLSEQAARDACAKLVRVNYACVTVPPQQLALAPIPGNG